MLQIYIYDSTGAKYELDLYEEEPLKLTLSAEEIGDIPVVNSAFSKQFRIPATQNNSRVFKWWYEVNTVDFDVTQRIAAEIHVDGVFYKSGHIRIEAAYTNEVSSNIDLGIIFFGETRDFASQVGEINLNQLNLTALDHGLTLATVEQSWADEWDPTRDYICPLPPPNGHPKEYVWYEGLMYECEDTNTNLVPPSNPAFWTLVAVPSIAQDTLRYILADRGYDYEIAPNNEVSPLQNVIAFNNNQGTVWTNSFDKTSNPLAISQFTLMVSAKEVIDAIFRQTDYNYSADSFFNDPQFAKLYTDAISEPSAEYTAGQATCEILVSGQQIVGGGEDRVQYNIIQSNPAAAWSNSTYQYTVGIDGAYAVQAQTVVGDYIAPGDPAGEYTLKIYKQSGAIVSLEYSQLEVLPVQGIVNINTGGIINAIQGDIIYVNLQSAGGSNDPYISNGSFEVTLAPIGVNVAGLMKYDVKCLDFLKGILTKFKMIMAPSADNEYEFVIKPWIDYIASGETFDWTNKLDVNKDVVLSPVFYEQSQLIEFTDKSDSDQTNLPFQLEYNRVYGALQFDSQNDLLKNTRKVESVFAPTPVKPVEGTNPGDPDNNPTPIEPSQFIIPYFSKLGSEITTTGQIVHIPMLTKPRLLWWNGLAPVKQGDGPSDKREHWWYTDGVTDIEANLFYPRMTPYSIVCPTTVDTINLNWFRETPLWNGTTIVNGEYVPSNEGESVYERYWNVYVQELYSPLARIMTAYFNIDAQDLYRLSFDDVIFIKNSYWRVLKIYDAPLTETATVKVDLVKILDYQTIPNINPPTPQGGGIDDVVVVGSGGGTEPPLALSYYQVRDCATGLILKEIGSAITLNITWSVEISGVGNEGCWTVIDYALTGPDGTVTAIYPDCATCTG